MYKIFTEKNNQVLNQNEIFSKKKKDSQNQKFSFKIIRNINKIEYLLY